MYKDARGNELKVGDVVAFNHPCGYKQTTMMVATIIEFGRYVTVRFGNGETANKQIAGLYKLHQN